MKPFPELNTRISSLYKELTHEVLNEYSLFKLGDRFTLTILAARMSKFISMNVDLQRPYALYATNKSPLSSLCKKNSLLLAEIIAGEFLAPLFVGEYGYSYKKTDFYDYKTDRKSNIHHPSLKDKALIREKGYNFIMLDDSIVSGTSFEVSLDELVHVTEVVDLFTVIDLRRSEHHETYANNYILQSKKLETIIGIITQKEYIFTTHMVRTIDNLAAEERAEVFIKAGRSLENYYLRAYKVYFEGVII
jgi:hypothetical protein